MPAFPIHDPSSGLPSATPRLRLVSASLCALIAILLLWAVFAKVDIVAVAPGKLVPARYLQIVQPAEAGIVREIRVRAGDTVAEGEILVGLDPTLNAADRTSVGDELTVARLELRRIEAQLNDEELREEPDDDPRLFAPIAARFRAHQRAHLDALAQETAAVERTSLELKAQREVLEKLTATLPVYERVAAAYSHLGTQQLVGRLQAEERQREAFEKAQDLKAQHAVVQALQEALRQQEKKRSQLVSAYASELSRERVAMIASIGRLEQQVSKLDYQNHLLLLRAPVAGTVKEVAPTTLGSVVQPGAILLTLVPDEEPLLAEVHIENKDAGFVRSGQTVRLKIAAYPFQKYGLLAGKVKNISADSSADATAVPSAINQALSFKTLVELNSQSLPASAGSLPLVAGMQVSAEIIQGRRTVLQYLLSPVRKVVDEAGRER